MEFNRFLAKMAEENEHILKEEETKNLAKEDSLSLIAAFVKDVKKKFSKKEDQLEILKAASKALTFYIDEIAESEPSMETSSSVGEFDNFDDEDEDEDLSGDEL